MRILVTGSRGWSDARTVWTALDAVAAGAAQGGIRLLTVVHGAAKGADELADRWVRTYGAGDPHVTAERHPALWQRYGKRAGVVRNELMVSRGADLALAFIAPCTDARCPDPKPHGSHGATHCAELADAAGITLRVWHLGEPGVTSMDSRHLADEDVVF
jgi:hypothetical protein